MSLLAIDIETFSDVDLPKCGVYAYSDSPLFEILLFAYAFDDEPTQVVDLACGEQLPDRVLAALEDENTTKTAFNAAFERTCISRHLGRRLSPVGWQCTAVQSAMLALPLTLDGVGEVLNIKRKKLKEGVALLRYFSMPCKPTKANGGRTRNRPEDAPEMWERFKAYCIRDVDAEREIREKLRNYPIPESEMELYRLDQEINDRGIMVDQRLAAQAVRCDSEFKARAIEKFIEDLGERYNIKEIAFDRWNATQMVQNLEDMGFTVVPFGQGYKDMSPPSKELYKLLMEGRINHGGNPVLKWMAQNVVMHQDPAGNIKPDKDKSTEKIDGIVATIMALDRAIRCQDATSVYDTRGLLFI